MSGSLTQMGPSGLGLDPGHRVGPLNWVPYHSFGLGFVRSGILFKGVIYMYILCDKLCMIFVYIYDINYYF